jgi:DNA-binding response OmpR family regulator
MPGVVVVSRAPKVLNSVGTYLREMGYDSIEFANVDEAMEGLPSILTPQALIIDVQGVPRNELGSGFDTFNLWMDRHLQQEGPPCIYLLTNGARRPRFRIEGTIVKKPFSIEELGRALRMQLGTPHVEREGRALEIDQDTNVLRCGENRVHLTNIETSLLCYLIEHEGQTLPPNLLLKDVWKYHDSAGASTLVRAHMSNLRRKLRSVVETDEQIQTIRGKGYRFIA